MPPENKPPAPFGRPQPVFWRSARSKGACGAWQGPRKAGCRFAACGGAATATYAGRRQCRGDYQGMVWSAKSLQQPSCVFQGCIQSSNSCA